MKIGVIGDVHGMIEELRELHGILLSIVDEVWSVGDLVDRGPDSSACVRYCRDNNINTIMGNHEHSTISRWDKMNSERAFVPRNDDHKRTVNQLSKEEVAWMRKLPPFHIHDATETVIVHGGMWPKLEWWNQPHNVIRAQLINPDSPGSSRWWGPNCKKRFGKSEDEFRAEGYSRWYELWDHSYNVVFGHSVFVQPHLQRNPGCGWTIGVDTGGCFGGSLTSAIIEKGKTPWFVSVKAKEVYNKDVEGKFDE